MTIPSRIQRVAPWAPLLSLSAAFALAACLSMPDPAPPDENDVAADDPSSDKYSVLSTLEYSILREYDKAAAIQGRRIRYPVCVSAEFSVDDATRRRYLSVEQQAVSRWNDALRGEPGWRVDAIELYLVGGAQPSSCPNNHDGMKVYKLVGLANQDRGYAEFYNFKNAIGRSEFARRI